MTVTSRAFAIDDNALHDLWDIWKLVADKDGNGRADKLTAKLEAFLFRLAELPYIGTRHDDRHPGLRSVGVPGLKTATVLFIVSPDTITVLRIGYLGRNVWHDVPS